MWSWFLEQGNGWLNRCELVSEVLPCFASFGVSCAEGANHIVLMRMTSPLYE